MMSPSTYSAQTSPVMPPEISGNLWRRSVNHFATLQQVVDRQVRYLGNQPPQQLNTVALYDLLGANAQEIQNAASLVSAGQQFSADA